MTRKMFTRIITALSRTLLDEELSVAQVAVLYQADERGQMRIGEIADVIGRSLPSTSRLVDDLAKRGFVIRSEDPDDRRARVIVLSPEGRKFLDRAGADRVRAIREAVTSMKLGDPAELMKALSKQSR